MAKEDFVPQLSLEETDFVESASRRAKVDERMEDCAGNPGGALRRRPGRRLDRRLRARTRLHEMFTAFRLRAVKSELAPS